MVLCMQDLKSDTFSTILERYKLILQLVEQGGKIPGSFWGDAEAGLIGRGVYVRGDTPVHSALHETCHYICMDRQRRHGLHTDAGGGYDEENGVCYLQILLAGEIPEMGQDHMFADMDAWGYSFRLGSARTWFEQDAGDAREWLFKEGIIDAENSPTWQLRN